MSRVDTWTSTVLTCAALLIAGTFVYREFFASAAPRVMRGEDASKPIYMERWREVADKGIHFGAANARVQILEFADLECPVCKSFDQRFQDVQKRFPNDVALVFFHYPLKIHRFAMPAARAFECAREQNRGGEFMRSIYERQDSLGLKSWVGYAHDAEVADTVAFATCVGRKDAFPQIDLGLSIGKSIEVRASPTVIINGWRMPIPPRTSEDLAQMVSSVLAGQSPSYKPLR